MTLLLDNGLPRAAATILASRGVDAVHVGDVGLADASDDVIADRAALERRIIVTLDADFHTRLALSGATGPSVIRIRVEGLKGEALASLKMRVLGRFRTELEAGAAISVGPRAVRCRLLPLR